MGAVLTGFIHIQPFSPYPSGNDMAVMRSMSLWSGSSRVIYTFVVHKGEITSFGMSTNFRRAYRWDEFKGW